METDEKKYSREGKSLLRDLISIEIYALGPTVFSATVFRPIIIYDPIPMHIWLPTIVAAVCRIAVVRSESDDLVGHVAHSCFA